MVKINWLLIQGASDIDKKVISLSNCLFVNELIAISSLYIHTQENMKS